MELQLTIQKVRRPFRDDPVELMDYLLRSLGFERNTEIYRKILEELLGEGKGSTAISEKVGARTTTIYHINKLIKSGLVIKRGSVYELREPTFERTVKEIFRDVERVFEDLLEVARELDRVLKLPRR
jgi:predicted transcriptional regulator